MSNSIITDTKEIEKLLVSFKANKAQLDIVVGDKDYKGHFTSVTEFTSNIKTNEAFESDSSEIEIYINASNNVYYGKCHLEHVSGDEIIVSLIDGIETRAKRKHKRADARGLVKILFSRIETPEEIRQKEEMKKVRPELSAIYKELSLSKPDVKSIMASILKVLKNFAPVFEVKMHKENESISFPINVAVRLKKILFTQKTDDNKSYLKKFNNERIMSFAEYFKYLQDHGKQDKDIKAELMKIINLDKSKGFYSYIVAPIILFEKAIGHIFVATTNTSSHFFRDHEVFFVMALCDIISEALAKSRITSMDKEGAFVSEVLDLSAGGIAVAIKDAYIPKFLHEDDKIRITMFFTRDNEEPYEIKTNGKILRFETSKEKIHMIVRLSDLKWNEIDYINKYVSTIIDKFGEEKEYK